MKVKSEKDISQNHSYAPPHCPHKRSNTKSHWKA